MNLLFPLHPRTVHFPIALSCVGAAFLAYSLLTGRRKWAEYGQITLFLGWLGILLAALTGLIDQTSAPDRPDVAALINQHITAGVGLVVVFGLALYWPLRDRKLFATPGRRWPYLGLLALGVALVLFDGWLGGKLVYTLGVGVGPH